MLWNPESQSTPWRTLKTEEYSLLHQGVQGESVPNKDPDVSETQFYILHYMTGYMLATSLLYRTEFYNKWVLGEQTIKVRGGKQ